MVRPAQSDKRLLRGQVTRGSNSNESNNNNHDTNRNMRTIKTRKTIHNYLLRTSLPLLSCSLLASPTTSSKSIEHVEVQSTVRIVGCCLRIFRIVHAYALALGTKKDTPNLGTAASCREPLEYFGLFGAGMCCGGWGLQAGRLRDWRGSETPWLRSSE